MSCLSEPIAVTLIIVIGMIVAIGIIASAVRHFNVLEHKRLSGTSRGDQ